MTLLAASKKKNNAAMKPMRLISPDRTSKKRPKSNVKPRSLIVHSIVRTGAAIGGHF
jgi:hypothetical protein